MSAFLNIFTILVSGVAGALLNEWFRKRRGRVQQIPLVERVNRLVTPELEGFTLARVVGVGRERALEEIRNVREYHFTLRNTSSVHLQDVEIQFEFPTQDVEAWAERPAMSKAALVPIACAAAPPWGKALRWKIPQLPSSDSVDLTFRAVNPSSEDYEVALYKCDRVIIGRSTGEPLRRGDPLGGASWLFLWGMLAVSAVAIAYSAADVFRAGTRATFVNEAGCVLNVTSEYDAINRGVLPWGGHGGSATPFRTWAQVPASWPRTSPKARPQSRPVPSSAAAS